MVLLLCCCHCFACFHECLFSDFIFTCWRVLGNDIGPEGLKYVLNVAWQRLQWAHEAKQPQPQASKTSRARGKGKKGKNRVVAGSAKGKAQRSSIAKAKNPSA